MSRNPYVRPVSKTTWYMRNGRYRKYMLREVTCLIVGFYSFFTICALGILAGYAAALKPMRETVQIHHDKFGNGIDVVRIGGRPGQGCRVGQGLTHQHELSSSGKLLDQQSLRTRVTDRGDRHQDGGTDAEKTFA